MAYQIFDTSKWPLFDVRFSKLPGGNVRLHISFDNIIFDGWSMFLILREWKMLYDNPEKEVEPLDLSFRDYVLAYEDIKKTEFYKRDEEYWQKRLPDILDFIIWKTASRTISPCLCGTGVNFMSS